MTPKLKALLVTVGVLVAGGTLYTVNLPKPDTDRADLVDAGIAACDPVVVRVRARIPPPALRARLADAGLDVPDMTRPDGGIRPRRFTQVTMRARLCGNDLVLPIQANGETGLEVFGEAELLTDAGLGPARPQVDEQCACRRRGGVCRLRSDGGLVPFDTELQPGTFVGAGCVAKSCGEIAGEQGASMPEVCR